MTEEEIEEESPVNDYIKKTEEVIKKLKEKKPGDRLDLVSLIEEAITAVNASTLGWSSWLKHPSIMKVFNETEINSITEDLRRMASEFLEFDIKWTKILQERKEAERKQKAKESEKKQDSKAVKHYVS
jgi:hypothetical protein